VDRIDFTIKKGEIVGLLGPNGAGKTTTLRMLTGYLAPSSGDIRIKDLSVADHPLAVKKLMGYLPESAPIYGDMLVFDYLSYVAAIRNIADAEISGRLKKMAGLCGLGSVMHQPVGELSKGYKQRVGLAHAMLDDPELLVLDEPTSGLDPNQIVEIRDIIREIGKEKTVILSTHILSEAEATCDRVIIINKGKIIADGDMASIQQSASTRPPLHLTISNADAAGIQTALSGIDAVGQVAVDEGESGIFKVTLTSSAEDDIRPAVYAVVKAEPWTLLEFHQQTQSLENTFRELTREN
jgi:ABC-2 type transport system ATP-binding protein